MAPREAWRRTIQDLATHISPQVGEQWKAWRYLRFVCDVIMEEMRTKPQGARIVFNAPPRHGKSLLISKWLPVWFLELFPKKRVLLASYAAELAAHWGRQVRDVFTNCPELWTKVKGGAGAGDRWETTQGGGMLTAGVGGGITGFGGHCFPSGTMVSTEVGDVDIATLAQLQCPPRVWTFNHATGAAELKRVVAASSRVANELVEVTTKQGRAVRATPDHPFGVGESGYRAAGALERGDRLRVVGSPEEHGVRLVWEGETGGRSVPSRVLSGAAPGDGPVELLSVWEDVRSSPVRSREAQAEGGEGGVLLPHVFLSEPGRGAASDPAVQDVWEVDAEQAGAPLLLGCLQGGCSPEAEPSLRSVWEILSPIELEVSVLQQGMCLGGAQREDDGGGPLALPGRHELREGVRRVAQGDSQEGRPEMRDVRRRGEEAANRLERETCRAEQLGRAPHQRRYDRQQLREPGDDVFAVPRPAPQVENDEVAMAERLRQGPHTVYDVQLEGNHNFFANGILVHNCMIIDDPCKNWQDAHSPTMRQHEQDWFSSTFYTRREPGAHIIVLMQRWHEDDMTGYLVKRHSDGWLHITLPAVAEDGDALGRSIGEPLCPERFDIEALEAIKLAQGNKWWGLYQQRPLPAGGSIIKPDWIQYYTSLPSDVAPRALSLDAAFKDGQSNSFVVVQAWGKRRADHYLLDQKRDHVDYPETEKMLLRMISRHPRCRARLVEDKANGTAIIQRMRHKIPGIIAITPHESKEARCQSCAPIFEAENVWVPDPSIAPWVLDLVDEWTTFPNAAFDDQVDCATQYLNWDASKGRAAGGGFGATVPH